MLTFAYIVGGWVWQDAYVIKKYFLKKNIVKSRNFKPQKLLQKLHDIEIKNNICIFFLHFEIALTSKVNMASRGLNSEPVNVILKGQEIRVKTCGGWVFKKIT